MQQNRSRAGEMVRRRYCAGDGWRLSDRGLPTRARGEEELLRLVPARVRTLRREGRANEPVPVIPRAKDGTTIEVTEWKSSDAIDAAHRNPDRHFPRFALSPPA
jgi:hypothetical protein